MKFEVMGRHRKFKFIWANKSIALAKIKLLLNMGSSIKDQEQTNNVTKSALLPVLKTSCRLVQEINFC